MKTFYKFTVFSMVVAYKFWDPLTFQDVMVYMIVLVLYELIDINWRGL